jgi:Fe-S cluster biogenesis protein NfuA
MTEDLKEKIVNLIDETINPGLELHGGSVELSELVPCNDSWKVKLAFKGGCHGCPSSVGSTLRSIEFFLREELDAPTLLVESTEQPW